MMKEKLETQFSTAEDPDWKALRNRTEAGAVDVGKGWGRTKVGQASCLSGQAGSLTYFRETIRAPSSRPTRV